MNHLPVPADPNLPVEGEYEDEAVYYADDAEYDEAGYDDAEYDELDADGNPIVYEAADGEIDDGSAPVGYADAGPAVEATSFTPSSDPIDVPDYIQLVDRLTELLWDEIDMIDTGNLPGISALQEEKERLSAAVRQTALLIAHDPTVLDDGSEYAAQDLEDLKVAVTAMNDAALANEQALRASLRSTDRLIRAVVRAVSDARAEPEARYSAFGVASTPKAAGQPAQKVNDVL